MSGTDVTPTPPVLLGPEFHQKLKDSLSDVVSDVTKIVQDMRKDQQSPSHYIDMQLRVEKSTEACNKALDETKTLIHSMERQITSLDNEMKQLEEREEMLNQERDDLLARGHELYWRGNCRELERTLADSFASREECLSVDSARCFRDEAGENLCRVTDDLRVGQIRASVLDNEIHSATKELGQYLEKWRHSRTDWVDTLDNLLDPQTEAIQNWLKDPQLTDKQRRLGERIIEYFKLAQQERHLSVQAVQSALGMRTFNTSLEFDYNTNQMQLQHLDELQSKVHVSMHEPGVCLHAAPASTNLVRDHMYDELAGDLDPGELQTATSISDVDYGLVHQGGKSLHRCCKVIDLSEGHDAQGASSPTVCRSWPTEGDDVDATDGQTTEGAEASGGRRDSDDEIVLGAVSSTGSGRTLDRMRSRSTFPIRRRPGSELMAKGDTDTKADVVPSVRSTPVTCQGASAGRDPFLVRLRRKFSSFTPRSESMTCTSGTDEIKLRASGSEPTRPQ